MVPSINNQIQRNYLCLFSVVALLLCFISCPQIASKKFCSKACAAHFVLAEVESENVYGKPTWYMVDGS